MDIPVLLIVVAMGLSLGSFITLASYRLPREQDIVKTGSRCPLCEAPLKVRDLVPVLSWMVNLGRCRYCGGGVHWRYPVIELTTAVIFAFLYGRYGVTTQSVLLALFSVALLIMLIADLEHYIIPDEVHYALLPLGIAYRVVQQALWDDMLLGVALGGGLGLALCYGYRWLRGKEVLGLGDVKFLAVAGLWLGATPFVPFLFISGMLGVVTGLIWRLRGLHGRFPFAPSLAVALFLCVIFPEVPAAFWAMQRDFYMKWNG